VRPLLKRTAARAVVLDPNDRLLLLQGRDPTRPGEPPWWELPGGGIERNETSAEAALRELREETGITEVTIGPCVFTQHARFTFAGIDFDQFEYLHLARVPAATVWAPQRLEALEAAALSGQAWWAAGDLAGIPERIIPDALRWAVTQLLAGPLPDTPIALTPQAPPPTPDDQAGSGPPTG
jgi:8-oxo-dGTP pyrophosphatase MutT (NUDIX family)